MHVIESIMSGSMEKIHQIADVDTVVGTPLLVSDEITVIPISKVSMGFMSGGGEYGQNERVKKANSDMEKSCSEYPFAGVAAQCMSLSPVAFLSINKGVVTMLPVEYNSPLDRLLDLFTPIVSSFTNKSEKPVGKCGGCGEN